MTNRIPHEIIDRASEFFITNREPSVEAGEREAFAQWLQQSPAHVQAYLEVASLWDDAAHISPVIAAESAETNVVPLQVGGVEEMQVVETSAPKSGGVDRRYFLRFAAMLVIAIAAGAVTWWQVTRAPMYTADVGEQRVLTLDDGSIVRLNSRSRLRVHLTPERRNVELIAGQALFEVAKDANRPFIVQSGDVAVRAIGTAFDVYKKDGGTVVTVVEGQVVVASTQRVSTQPNDAEGSAADFPVGAGEQVTVSATGAITHTENANVTAATSWLQQELIFTGEPLSAVVEEFNRYSRRTIVLSDPTLADLRINAVFHSTNPDALLKFVIRYDGVEVIETGTEIRIARRESRGP